MSFHKLKLGPSKKDHNKHSNINSQKNKDKNQQIAHNIHIDNKTHYNKTNIISMSDDFNFQLFNNKKKQLHIGPKTDRLHKIQKIDFPIPKQEKLDFSIQKTEKLDFPIQKTEKIERNEFSIPKNQKRTSVNQKQPYFFNYSNYEQNQQYSAQQLIDFLGNKQVQKKEIQNKNLIKESKQILSEDKKIITEAKHIYSIKHFNPQQLTDPKPLVQQIKKQKKIIDLEEKPLNYDATTTKGTEQDLRFQKKQDNQLISQQVSNLQPIEQIKKVGSKGIIEIQKQPQKQQDKIQPKKINQINSVSDKNITLAKQIIDNVPLKVVTQSQSLISSPLKKKSSPVVEKHKQSPSGSTDKSPSEQLIISPVKSKLSYKPINEIQVTILQQNKTLTQDNEKLRKQRDQLLFSNKRLQVQLLQTNCKQYYERQLTRLKNQVETLQSAQEQLKHNHFILQNKNKQLESSQDLNKKQNKKLLKQLENIKIQSTKEKYQMKQKTSSLQHLIKQLQQRNLDLSDKFEEYYKKYQQVQKNFKHKCEEEIRLQKHSQNLQAKIYNNQKSYQQKIKHYEQQIHKFSSQSNQLSNEFRNFKRQSESQVQGLKQNVKQLNLKRESEALLISSRAKTLQKHNHIIEAELQVVRLEQTVKQLESQIQKRSQLIRQLNNKIDSMISMADYEQMRKRLESVCHDKLILTQQYQKQALSLNHQIEELTRVNQQIRKKFEENQGELRQRENINENTSRKGTSSNSNKIDSFNQKQNFKEILRQQIQQCDSLKQQLFSKSQIIFQSKQEYEQLKLKYESIKNDQDILKKQFTSSQNNSKIKKQILQQELINQVQSIKRKMTVLQKRYQSKIKQNKEKQSFITNFIVGKSSQNDAQYLIQELQRVFLEKEKLSHQ